MRKFLLPLLIFLIACGGKKKEAGTKNENTYYLLSLEGIDSLKLGMTKVQLEKVLNTTLNLKHIKVDEAGYDTVPVKYKDADLILYLEEDRDSSVAHLIGLSTSYPSCKTTSGIAVGTDKINVIETYADHLKYVAPEYEVYPVRSLTKSVVAVMDTAMPYKALVFHIVNRKVVSMELSSYYEFY
ncbi:MAG TPA: hypothetical protein VMZ03_09780 [Chitinophagaceae bacterium]|nr:hypothetical protein [Chitinophagaceae bacterium]